MKSGSTKPELTLLLNACNIEFLHILIAMLKALWGMKPCLILVSFCQESRHDLQFNQVCSPR